MINIISSRFVALALYIQNQNKIGRFFILNAKTYLIFFFNNEPTAIEKVVIFQLNNECLFSKSVYMYVCMAKSFGRVLLNEFINSSFFFQFNFFSISSWIYTTCVLK
jgi:hypothetical protein